MAPASVLERHEQQAAEEVVAERRTRPSGGWALVIALALAPFALDAWLWFITPDLGDGGAPLAIDVVMEIGAFAFLIFPLMVVARWRHALNIGGVVAGASAIGFTYCVLASHGTFADGWVVGQMAGIGAFGALLMAARPAWARLTAGR